MYHTCSLISDIVRQRGQVAKVMYFGSDCCGFKVYGTQHWKTLDGDIGNGNFTSLVLYTSYFNAISV